jgi:hypothetical protein
MIEVPYQFAVAGELQDASSLASPAIQTKPFESTITVCSVSGHFGETSGRPRH